MNLLPLAEGITPIQRDTSLSKIPYSNTTWTPNEVRSALDNYYNTYNEKPEEMVGWDRAPGTDYLKTYRNGNTAATFSPVIDSDNYMTQSELRNYADDVMNGRYDDYLGLQQGTMYTGDGSYEQANNERRTAQWLNLLQSAIRQNNLYNMGTEVTPINRNTGYDYDTGETFSMTNDTVKNKDYLNLAKKRKMIEEYLNTQATEVI